MKHISELERILSHLLDWNKARISCLVQILQALFSVKTVNLSQIANSFHTEAKQDSSYRRIRRFFKDFSFDREKRHIYTAHTPKHCRNWMIFFFFRISFV